MKVCLLLACALLAVSCAGASEEGSAPDAKAGGGAAGGSATTNKGGSTNAAGASGSTGGNKLPAEAGVYLEIRQQADRPAGTACSTTSTTHSVGTPAPGATSPGTAVVDGDDGAKITCTVSGDNVFAVEGSLIVGDLSFSVFAELSPNAAGVGAIKIYTPETLALIDEKCELLPIDLNQGSAWVKFDCNLTGSSTVACGGAGYFVLQNCAN